MKNPISLKQVIKDCADDLTTTLLKVYKGLPKKERTQLLMDIIDWEILKKLKKATKKYEASIKP